MCEYFVKADPILFESRSRTVRIHGALTSIRLENMMWDVLAEMAAAEHLTTSGLISRFHNEIMASGIEALNFASFLRVTCVRYMRKQLDDVKSERKPALPAASNLVSLQARN